MSNKRTLLGSMVGVLLVACSPGTSGTSGNAGGNDPSGSGANDPDSSSATFMETGSTGTSIVSNCTDPECVGADPQGGCDGSIAVDSADAMDGARAMGLCKVSDGTSWGVLSAQWVQSDGVPLSGVLLDGKGILSNFGPVAPREGGQILALSSGAARDPGDPGYQPPSGYQKDFFNSHGSPPGYPKESPACPGVITGEPYDSAGLSVRIKTPTDAKSLSFNMDFYTYEFPIFICDIYNDFFVAMMSPKPAELPDGNISFDPDGNTISVNAGFLDVCSPQVAGGKNFACTQGTGALSGTGFEGAAATGWLETKAPIEAPGSEITLLFAIWDSGDASLDSTVLIDNFKFEADGTTTGTQPIPQ